METVPRGSETVLLVEADPETRKLAAFMLQKRGYTVVEARSTADALQLYESGQVHADLLLTEVLMPKMSGTKLATRLREMDALLRVLYMSHAADRTMRELAIDLEVGFLRKPFTMGMLAGKVRQALDAPRARALGTNV
jgi:two-component system, cell cycle sensor histidine kinase and response regulator CckA